MASPTRPYLALLIAVVLLVLVVGFWVGLRDVPEREVVVYVSVDQHIAEPVLNDFQQQTGIHVRAVYDVEASKTTGLVQRLIAEKDAPRADVFWNGEISQTILLKQHDVLTPASVAAADDIPASFKDPQGYWTGFGGRARVFIYNTDLVEPDRCPTKLEDLVAEGFPLDKFGIAYPLFGTTATHAAALYTAWGDQRARRFFTALRDGGVTVVDGNATVRDRVAAGTLHYGLTDTDDAAAALSRGAPVAIVFPDQHPGGMGTLVVPNTVAQVAGGANTETATQLIEYLLSRQTAARLVEDGWFQVTLRDIDVRPAHFPDRQVRPMDVDFKAVAEAMPRVSKELSAIFVR